MYSKTLQNICIVWSALPKCRFEKEINMKLTQLRTNKLND